MNTYRLIQGHVLEVLPTLEAESINLVCTSPPYWGLRDYGSSASTVWGGSSSCNHEWSSTIEKKMSGGTKSEKVQIKGTANFQIYESQSNFCVKCRAWRGQLGLEPHPSLYISHLVEIARELKRVLRKDGCFYLNLGDTYGGTRWSNKPSTTGKSQVCSDIVLNKPYDGKWLQPKQLLGMPWRVAIALQGEGWILRNANVWHKPNAMPSSVKDRLNNTYELIFHFVKSRRYWYDLDAIRVPHKGLPSGNIQRKNNLQPQAHALNRSNFGVGIPWTPTEKGKNPGDFWIVNTKPFKGAHFAVFPPTLIEPIIKSSCPQWICQRCGKPRERLSNIKYIIDRKSTKINEPKAIRVMKQFSHGYAIHETVGWSDCGCGAGWKSGTVLDPFNGSGTTMLVARDLARSCLGIDAVSEYCGIARDRVFGKQYLDRQVEYVYEQP